MSLAILFHFLCTQHVSDINISIIRSLRLCCWVTASVVLFSVLCVLENWCGWVSVVSVLQAQTQPHQISNTHRTKNKTTDAVIQQHSRKLLMMDILMSETCWVHKKGNKITSGIKLVSYSSTITMMHGPINIRDFSCTLLNNSDFHAHSPQYRTLFLMLPTPISGAERTFILKFIWDSFSDLHLSVLRVLCQRRWYSHTPQYGERPYQSR